MALSFEIYNGGRRLTSFAVRGAAIVGAESIPGPGRVAFSEGLLRVEPAETSGLDAFGEYHAATYVVPGIADVAQPNSPTSDFDDDLTAPPAVRTAAACGVSLLWDAGAAGQYMLETTRLPPRVEPYVLNVELARHRLMKLVHKQEDWNLWDMPEAKPALEQARQATRTFAGALGKLPDGAAASVLADEALGLAIAAGEELARVHAAVLLDRRKRARRGGIPRTVVGARVSPAITSEAYRQAVAGGFDFVNLPLPWRKLQPDEEIFLTDEPDKAVEFCARSRLPTVAGPLVDLSEGQVPEWLFIYEHDFDTLRQLAFEYVRSVVTRYRKVVKLWNVVAGLHAPGSFGLSFEQMVELTRLLVGQVKRVLPGSKTLVTVRLPFGEYLAAGGSSTGVPPMLYAEMVAQSGVEVDGFGVEILTGVPRRGLYCRDLLQISHMLDGFAQLNKPVFVVAAGCPDRVGQRGGVDPADGGRWHEAWSPARQADWLREVYQIALSKPFVENIAWADLADTGDTRLPGGGLLDDMLRPKPAMASLQALRHDLRAAREATAKVAGG